jgi:hypothetical protein
MLASKDFSKKLKTAEQKPRRNWKKPEKAKLLATY